MDGPQAGSLIIILSYRREFIIAKNVFQFKFENICISTLRDGCFEQSICKWILFRTLMLLMLSKCKLFSHGTKHIFLYYNI